MVSSGKSPHDDEDAGFLVVDSCPMHPMPWTIPKDTLFPTHGWYQSSLHCSFTMWIATSSSWLFYHKWLGRLLASTSKIQSVYNFDSFPFRTHGNSCLFIHMTTFTPKESKSHPHAAGPGWPDSDGERERDPHAENVLSSSMHGHGMISFFFEAVFFFDGLVSGTTGNPIDRAGLWSVDQGPKRHFGWAGAKCWWLP